MDKNQIINKMKNLIDILNKASQAYYNGKESTLTDKQWDSLYDELKALEDTTDVVLSNSPTHFVGYAVESEWKKAKHEYPALSLNKTKDRNELKQWLKNKEAILSWKEDGLTVVMTYDGGKLTSLITRGNGAEGEDITVNAPYISGVPLYIPYKGHLVTRGEALISYEHFEKINATFKNEEDKYKTPRNLASGSIRNLDGKVVAERYLEVKTFELVNTEDISAFTFGSALEFLKQNGFDIVEYELVWDENILETIEHFEKMISNYAYPTDGLVLVYNDIEYGRSLGITSHHPLNAMAFKWNDETYETTLTGVEWSPSRTGLINPVAEFESVNIDGADISRASVHNLSIMEELQLGIGDIVEVYLANKIIPQIANNQTRSNSVEIPGTCPVCGATTEIKATTSGERITKMLMCPNPFCKAKLLGNLELYVSKDGMNIDGLSRSTLELLYNNGFIEDATDLYHLKNYKKDIAKLEGMGSRSVTKLMTAIEESRKVTLDKFIRSLGIDLVGRSVSKDLAKFCNYDIKVFLQHIDEETNFTNYINGFGEKMNDSLHSWFGKTKNWEFVNNLLDELIFEAPMEGKTSLTGTNLKGQTFVITGSLKHYNNRDALKEVLEALGAKVSGSVTSKTTALINNDINSTSSKNKKAKELSIPIWSEEQLIEYIKG